MEEPQRRPGVVSLCVGCGRQILDRFFLRVFPDLQWHAACLKCSECEQNLDESHTCFIKEGRTLCKKDYSRLYGSRCLRCFVSLDRGDLVMRTRGGGVYHVACFRCVSCDCQLLPGDRFTLRDGKLHCTQHSDAAAVCDPRWSGVPRSERVTRVRTVLSEAQLHTLRSCYSSNPRPDALLKEHLVQITGLSPRVIRVWFQNKRCKDKKKNTASKYLQHPQGGVEEPRFAASLDGVDRDLLMTPLGFQSLQPSWNILTCFCLHPDGELDQGAHRQLGCGSERMTSCSSAESETAPISIHLPNTPCSFNTSPTEAFK